MKVTIEGDIKGISALVAALQERKERQTQEVRLLIDGKAIAKAAFGATGDRPEGKCY